MYSSLLLVVCAECEAVLPDQTILDGLKSCGVELRIRLRFGDGLKQSFCG